MEDNIKAPISGATVLSLDIATNTGYAIYRNGKIIDYGLWAFKPNGKRFKQFRDKLLITIRDYHITQIVAEGIYKSPNRRNAYPVLSKFHEKLKYASSVTRVPCKDISPIDAKKSTTGNPVAKKEEIIRVVQSYGYVLSGKKVDDMADAISIMLTYLKLNGMDIRHPYTF